jgi:hypothetical protein
MHNANHKPARTAGDELKQLIEPLACYICAVDRPKVALIWALVILVNEVGQNNKAARDHISVMAENYLG